MRSWWKWTISILGRQQKQDTGCNEEGHKLRHGQQKILVFSCVLFAELSSFGPTLSEVCHWQTAYGEQLASNSCFNKIFSFDAVGIFWRRKEDKNRSLLRDLPREGNLIHLSCNFHSHHVTQQTVCRILAPLTIDPSDKINAQVLLATPSRLLGGNSSRVTI